MIKTGVSSSGIFTIKEYRMEGKMDPAALIRRLQAGPCQVQEVISYVFEGEDPLGLDAKSFSADAFLELYPQLGSYGSGLAFDVIMKTEGPPVTVELTKGDTAISLNSLDRDIELEELLGEIEVPLDMADHKGGCGEMAGEKGSGETAGDKEESGRVFFCSDIPDGLEESLAADNGRAALQALLLCGQPEYEGLDLDRVIRMCLLYGIPGLQENFACQLLAEMEEQKTPEARLYRELREHYARTAHFVRPSELV